ncbi:MAG: hypothetical protein RLZZ292_297 [Bacteroidota bacterium]
MSNFAKIGKENNIDVSAGLNAEAGRKIGEVLGVKLFEMNCTNYMKLIQMYMAGEAETKVSKEDKTNEFTPS